jgi:hypothetical protein
LQQDAPGDRHGGCSAPDPDETVEEQLLEGAPATCLPGARRRRPKARACWERRVPPKGRRSSSIDGWPFCCLRNTCGDHKLQYSRIAPFPTSFSDPVR